MEPCSCVGRKRRPPGAVLMLFLATGGNIFPATSLGDVVPGTDFFISFAQQFFSSSHFLAYAFVFLFYF